MDHAARGSPPRERFSAPHSRSRRNRTHRAAHRRAGARAGPLRHGARPASGGGSVRHASLVVLAGDVLGADLAPALAGQDTVVSLLGRGLSLRSEQLMARATPRIVAAMERARIARLVFLSPTASAVPSRRASPHPAAVSADVLGHLRRQGRRGNGRAREQPELDDPRAGQVSHQRPGRGPDTGRARTFAFRVSRRSRGPTWQPPSSARSTIPPRFESGSSSPGEARTKLPTLSPRGDDGNARAGESST